MTVTVKVNNNIEQSLLRSFQTIPLLLTMVGPTALFNIVSTILFSNDEATRLFMAFGTGKVCIHRTNMSTVVGILVL